MQQATLGGFPLLASSPVIWRSTEGVRPYIGVFDIDPETGKQLRLLGRGGTEISLKIVDGGTVNEWRRLSVVGVIPGPNPHIDRVRVADLRYWWKYVHVLRRYNVRRNVGFKRRADMAAPLLQDLTPRVWFARWSLYPRTNPSTPWTPRQILQDVALSSDALGLSELRIASELDRGLQRLRVEDLALDDTGENAMARVLALIPGSACTVDADGVVAIYSKASGGDRKQVATLGPEIVGGGHVNELDNSIVRPREIHVYFTIESEVRFNFLEDETATGANTVAEGDPDARECENVLPVPDFSLTLASGKSVAQGTWITVDEALESWTSPPGVLGNPSLTDWHRLIRMAFIPENDLWAALFLTGQADLSASDDNWSARIAALQANYRRTFRINARWMDRILQLKAYSVATVDPTSGQRGPAYVYSDHAIKGSQKQLFRSARQGRPLAYCWNVPGYADVIDSTTKPAPARVQIMDPDQGILHCNYVLDPFNMTEVVFPSWVNEAPTPDLSQPWTPIAFNQVAKGKRPSLAAEHKIAFIVSAVPAAPNSKAQLYKIVVRPEEIGHLLPQAARAGLRENYGPIREIRVGPGLEVARIRWKDDRAQDIEKLFGVRPGTPNLTDLIVNDFAGGAMAEGAASLRVIAHAVAAQAYAQYSNHQSGDAVGRMSSGIRLDGWMKSAQHQLNPDGSAVTAIDLPEEKEPLDVFAFMDEGTRQILLREVVPEKGGAGG